MSTLISGGFLQNAPWDQASRQADRGGFRLLCQRERRHATLSLSCSMVCVFVPSVQTAFVQLRCCPRIGASLCQRIPPPPHTHTHSNYHVPSLQSLFSCIARSHGREINCEGLPTKDAVITSVRSVRNAAKTSQTTFADDFCRRFTQTAYLVEKRTM